MLYLRTLNYKYLYVLSGLCAALGLRRPALYRPPSGLVPSGMVPPFGLVPLFGLVPSGLEPPFGLAPSGLIEAVLLRYFWTVWRDLGQLGSYARPLCSNLIRHTFWIVWAVRSYLLHSVQRDL